MKTRKGIVCEGENAGANASRPFSAASSAATRIRGFLSSPSLCKQAYASLAPLETPPALLNTPSFRRAPFPPSPSSLSLEAGQFRLHQRGVTIAARVIRCQGVRERPAGRLAGLTEEKAHDSCEWTRRFVP